MKKFISLGVLALTMAVSLFPNQSVYAKKDIEIIIDGSPLHSQQSPIIDNDRTLVPLRSLSEALGYKVDWNSKEQKLLIHCPDQGSLVLYYNQKTYYLNGVKKESDQCPKLIGTSTYIPIRLLTDSFQLPLDNGYSQDTFQIVIDRKGHFSKGNLPENQEQNIALSQDEESLLSGKHPIEGMPRATAEQMANFLLKKNPNPRINCSALELAQLYLIEGQKEGIRGDYAFCQAIKETGYFRYGGDVLPAQNNYAGIGTVGGGAKGCYFPNPQMGVRAQIQHLKAYSSKAALNLEQVDPRYHLVTKGIAPTMEDLNGKWAVPGHGYGQDILSIYQTMVER